MADRTMPQGVAALGEPAVKRRQPLGKFVVENFGYFTNVVRLRQRRHRSCPSRLGVVGVERDRAVKGRLRLLALPHMDQQIPKTVPRDSVAGICFDNLPEVIDRVGSPAAHFQDLCPVKTGVDEARV